MIIDSSTEQGRKLAAELDKMELGSKIDSARADIRHAEDKLESIRSVVRETVEASRDEKDVTFDDLMQCLKSIERILND